MYSQRIVVPTNGKTATREPPTPNIILTNYTYGDKVSAGQVFRLNMEFMNTSQVSPIENVVISAGNRRRFIYQLVPPTHFMFQRWDRVRKKTAGGCPGIVPDKGFQGTVP